MLITLIDDSVPFDGATPGERALDGAPRALAGLAAALARRGHDVTVISRCAETVTVEGVVWMPRDLPPPPHADVSVALRRPALLDALPDAPRKVLWVTDRAGYLDSASALEVLKRHRPQLVFQTRTQVATCANRLGLDIAVVAPGVAEAFRTHPEEIGGGPMAVATVHPLGGLERLLDLWTDEIYPKRFDAALKVFSGSLARAEEAGRVPDDLKAIHRRLEEDRTRGVTVRRPGSDTEMASAYRAARVHLYPGDGRGAYPWTLADSQACGLPAVSFPGDAVAAVLRNGETGYLVPDDAAFVNLTLDLLSGGAGYDALRAGALARQGGRGWDAAAADFERLWV